MVIVGHIFALSASHSSLIMASASTRCLRRFGSGMSDPKPPAQRTARAEPTFSSPRWTKLQHSPRCQTLHQPKMRICSIWSKRISCC